ncbi:MAG TPA: tripartite tricarboxylate transporter substrate-binding protein [Xanthobacteraceae bacterium]|nr:tripartite tricarboxylate transporter substrate-binding protein [Xanthobacteraceae bacterium]
MRCKLAASLVLSFWPMLPAGAQTDAAIESFYRGSQIKLISEAGPSSGYTAWARLIGQYLPRHLPGQPSIVVQSMGGAGGLIASNYMYSVASHDGRELAAMSRETALMAVMGAPGVRYDPLRFNWLGSPTSETNVCFVDRDAPVHSLADLHSKELLFGTDGAGSGMHIYPTALNALVNTRFKVIDGYAETGGVLLAIDRGEVQGACISAATITQTRGEALRSGRLRFILQGGLAPDPRFPDVPYVLDLASNDEQRQALRLLYSAEAFGRPYAAPPGVPAERVAALRKAFTDTFADADFRADAMRQGFDVRPITGEAMTGLVEEMVRTPKSIIDRVAPLMRPGGK